MRFSVLASGSTGNSFFIESKNSKVLVDAGLSGKQIEKLLEEAGVNAADLDAILITHEHSDHIKGVGVLARRYQLPVYANSKTWEQLDRQLGKIAEDQRLIMEAGEMTEFGDMKVESYGTSHDAAEPMGFCFYENDMKVSLTTDLGYVSQRIKDTVRGSDAYVFESNHDVEMLRMGSYPWNTKRRILSDVGHLSNETAGEALGDILAGKGETVYLAHLSKENNMTELARLTVKNILEDYGFKDQEHVKLMDTSPVRPTKMQEIIRK
ncbi:MBL fold metallo-hydrolase [Aneurinibacillus migulanus]|uniref:Metallohydrolase n=1 Tax=Aneurinibacillus migulanus TaxID=47500 RepID=A0A0D1VYQ7_ANEMI|nr:MBL fold metallo-hydrolase [Aneurinibacillus migulanus]KIV51370.1 metallohydrolase [Aneurinibacillus migulanus]KON93186.1 metallohydrolase [Aneurinibacillus migulanus]MED0896071.1 MBL fold metallo-hydrolase [Aneurinibacillus migulanus]MED1618903.1 MBL fold metallo-hydrolase [Aneurinibacillus migulanus]CEH32582.1 Metallo-beta-lactamase domain protein [Aneurinibacillus migulanus]